MKFAEMSESFQADLSFVGRARDAWTGDPLGESDYSVALLAPPIEALRKRDGYFVLQGVKPSAVPYRFRFSSARYQPREFSEALPAAGSRTLAFAGEDELHLSVRSVLPGSHQIGFERIPVLPRIRQGARVLGEGAFATTLKADLSGVDVAAATLETVSGLAPGQFVRIVRSADLLARPGPYYAFPAGTTVLAVRVVEALDPSTPVAGARLRLVRVNGKPIAKRAVAGVDLQHVLLDAPATPLILGTAAQLDSVTDMRGNAVFAFPGHWPLSALELEIAHPQRAARTRSVAVQAGGRTSWIESLDGT